jgi:hypothetical protein
MMLKNKQLFEHGLCKWRWNMYTLGLITQDECKFLFDYIYDNKPNDRNGFFFWPVNKIQPRLDWIKEQLKKFEK